MNRQRKKKMKRNRVDRRADFEKFYNNSREVFQTICSSDLSAKVFCNEYILNICPGSRAGGCDKTIVEVFWGFRLYEVECKGNKMKSKTETGATLYFCMADTGHVMVSLYPAHTEKIRPIEDSICLYNWLDPKCLNNERFIKSVWNDFMAYMQYTSLDGTPSLWQRFRVWYLRLVKHLIVDNKWQPTKLHIGCMEVVKYTLTVGLSGCLVYLVTLFTQSNDSKIVEQLQQLNSNIEKIIEIQSFSSSSDLSTSRQQPTDSILPPSSNLPTNESTH